MANFFATSRFQHCKTVLFDVYFVFYWTWDIYVVNYLFLWFFNSLSTSIQFQSFYDKSLLFNRYPDFLTQMQDYVNLSYTLCNVVGGKIFPIKSYATEYVYILCFENWDRVNFLTVVLSSNRGNSTLYQLGRENVKMDLCDVDSSNTLTFKIILMMGAVFVCLSAIISFYIDKVDRKVLLSKQIFSCLSVSITITIWLSFLIYFL